MITPDQMGSWAGIPIFRHQLVSLKMRWKVRIATLPTIASTPYIQWVGKDLEQLDFTIKVFNLADIRTWQAQQNQLADPIKIFNMGNFGGNDWVLTRLRINQNHINYTTGDGSANSREYRATFDITAMRESF